MFKLNRYVMHKIMYTILLLISTLSFCQETDIEISKSEVFKNLLNLHKNASEEKHNIDYYSVQIYNGNFKDADSIYNLCQELDMDKKDVVAFFQELRLFFEGDFCNNQELMNDIEELFEDYNFKLKTFDQINYFQKTNKINLVLLSDEKDIEKIKIYDWC